MSSSRINANLHAPSNTHKGGLEDKQRRRRCTGTLNTACIVLALTLPRTDLALSYVHCKRRNKKDRSPITWDDIHAHYESIGDAGKAQLLTLGDEKARKQVLVAKAWIRDADVSNWVTEMNMNRGVAPRHIHIWQEKVKHGVETGRASTFGGQSPALVKIRSRNQWVRQWSKR